MHLRAVSMTLFLSVLILVWTADIGAYFVGKSFGKNKLAIRLSPGKSIEGAIGGGVLVLIVAFLGSFVVDDMKLFQLNFFDFLNQSIGWLGMIVITIICVLMSIQGDLFESQLKRIAGVKDSSNLLPGHGGFLDRIDALLPVLPLAGLIVILITQ
jgi:phosphatidate cytidylyltransferase